MRIPEIITELFDSTTQWKLETATDVLRKYSWTTGDIGYVLKAENTMPSVSYWWVDFRATNPDVSALGITGTGNELQVFSTVIDILVNDFIPEVDPKTVAFSAVFTDWKGIPNGRADLYTRMVKRFLPPTHEVEIEDFEKGRAFIVRKKQNENI